MIVKAGQFQTTLDTCISLGYSTRELNHGRLRLYKQGLLKPKKAATMFFRQPREAVGMILGGSGWEPSNPRHKDEKLYRHSQMIHLQNNLAYESPMDGSKIPVHPSVTESMFDGRQGKDCFFIPAPPDELAHIIPHCVFDKDGEFPTYYVNKCQKLFKTVSDDKEQLHQFKHLLENIFFKAAQLVFELVKAERYSDIRSELKTFSGY